mmetsp:Transcript_64517/g.178893  ORF Transcript_64517/g.178893 Transcript_64517/m.178893 type:complete len:234 (-) Transcript_64517:25-726(-)
MCRGTPSALTRTGMGCRRVACSTAWRLSPGPGQRGRGPRFPARSTSAPARWRGPSWSLRRSRAGSGTWRGHPTVPHPVAARSRGTARSHHGGSRRSPGRSPARRRNRSRPAATASQARSPATASGRSPRGGSCTVRRRVRAPGALWPRRSPTAAGRPLAGRRRGGQRPWTGCGPWGLRRRAGLSWSMSCSDVPRHWCAASVVGRPSGRSQFSVLIAEPALSEWAMYTRTPASP